MERDRWRRHHWLGEITRLDPARDFEQIARIATLYEFPWDVQQALSFALFRTYAVPSIGRLLYETGEFTHHAQRRHDDTVLILEAIGVDGMESTNGRTAIRRMNQMHGRYDICNDDMRYVLSTFVVTPHRWIQRYGWRPPSDAEREANVRYYRRLGRLMGIHDVPETFDDFARLMDEYEAAHFAPDEGGRAVARITMRLFATFYWRPIRPAVRLFSVAILDEPLREALGFARPPRFVVVAAHAALRWRGRLVRWLPPRQRPQYARDLQRIRSYPGGHLIERLGTFAEREDEDVAGRLGA